MTKWLRTATRFALLVQSDRNAELISMLKRGSERLDDIQEDFKDIMEQFAVYSLLEEIPFPRIGKVRYEQAYPLEEEDEAYGRLDCGKGVCVAWIPRERSSYPC